MVDNKGPAEGLPKNPLFKCRVFVGNLPTDFLTKPEVVTRFEKWGPVTEVSLHRGFAFVQFKSTEDAQAAIKGEKGTDFKGSEIDCSFAKHERGSGNKTERPGGGPRGKSPPRGGGGGRFDDRDKERDRFRDLDRERDRDRFPSYDRDRPPFDRDGPLPPPRGPRDRSPLRDRFDDDRYRDPYRRDDLLRRDRFYDERRSPPRRDPRDLDPYDRERLPPLRDDPYRRDDPRDRDDPYLRDRERDVLSRDRDDPYRRDRFDDRDRDLYDRDRAALYRDRDLRDPLDRRGPPPPPVSGQDPSLDGPIDCEIIVVNKAQRDYAEAVRNKVKTIVQVGIIYLNSEMSLVTALDDVSRRGVLYAIVLTAQHEMHKSVTVNILHGTPQEHRNMPLDKAMGLIGSNFDRYMQNLREKSGIPGGAAVPSRAAPPPISPPVRQPGPPPPAATGGGGAGQGSFSALGPSDVPLSIPNLLNLLADGKQLTIDELARVIEFLQELRQRMIRDQGGDPAAETKGSGQPSGGPPKPQSQNAQIQAKILSMIRPGGGSSASPGLPSKMPPINVPSRDMPPGNQPPLPPVKSMPPMPQGMPPGPRGMPPRPQGMPPGPQGMPPGQPPTPGGPAIIRALSQQPPPPPSSAPGGPGVRPPQPPAPAGPAAPPVTSGNINFDNPNVKKALDNLIQSGPNLLRTIGQVSSSGPTQPTTSQPATSPTIPGQAAPTPNLTPAQQQMQQQHAQYAQYQAAAQHNAMLQAHMQAQAAYRHMNPGQQQAQQQAQQQQGYMNQMMQQGGPRYGAPY